MMNQMKQIIREYMSKQEAFWFSYHNCWLLVDRLADEHDIRLMDWMHDNLAEWMMKEL